MVPAKNRLLEQQHELPGLEGERVWIIEKIQMLGNLAVSEMAERYQADTFAYADIKSFAFEQGRNINEAGKIFSSFYRGLKDLGVEPPKFRQARKYEHNRDSYAYPLTLVSQVLKTRNPQEEGFYDSLLREFHNARIESWFEKQSTSA